MDILTFSYSRSYSPPAPVLEIQVWRVGRTAGYETVQALVDSGADGTLLPISLLKRVNARYVGQVGIRGMENVTQQADYYLVSLRVGTTEIPAVYVVAVETEGEALIGRNVLNHLVVTLNGPAQVTEVSG